MMLHSVDYLDLFSTVVVSWQWLLQAAVAKDGPAPDVVAASLADLFRRVAVAHRDAGLVPPDEFTSGGRSGQAALRVVTTQYLLVAVLDQGTNWLDGCRMIAFVGS